MPAPAVGHVRVACVVGMRPPENTLQATFLFRNRHDVDVVAHQAVVPHAQSVAPGVIEERVEVDLALRAETDSHAVRRNEGAGLSNGNFL